jgi:hypothetical protein
MMQRRFFNAARKAAFSALWKEYCEEEMRRPDPA